MTEAGAPAAAARDERPGELPRGLLPLLTLTIFVVVADSRVMTSMLPQIADDLDSSVGAAGLALTAYLLAYGTFQLVYGPLADRVGPVRVMTVACALLVGALALTALAPSLGALIGIRFLTGAIASAFFPLALATVGNLLAYEHRQVAIGTLLAAVATGQVLGAAIGGIVTDLLSWRAMYVIDAVVAAALVLPLWRRRSTVAARPSSGHPLAGHRRLLRNPRALLLYVLVLVEGAAFFGGLGYLGALLHDEYGVGPAWVGLILMVDGAAIFVTSRRIGPIGARLGEDRLIVLGSSLMAGGYLFALVLGRWEAVVPAVVALGAGFALCHTTLQTRATELDPEARGTAISLFAFGLFFGSALGTAVLGRVLAAGGYDAVLLVAGLTLAAFALLAPRLSVSAVPARA